MPSPMQTSSPSPDKHSTHSSPDQYTDPDLRDRIKQQVIAGDKGGNPGQWSARKAQLVAREYEAQGGGYKHPRTEAQEHLHEWTEEHWTTSDGRPAKRAAGMARYLPEKAWQQLSPEEKKATNQKKLTASKKGRQFVPNTPVAAEARSSAQAGTTAPEKAGKSSARPKNHAHRNASASTK